MDTLKRLARWLLRDELARGSATNRELRAKAHQARLNSDHLLCKLNAVNRLVSCMGPWVRNNRPADTVLLAWSELLAQGPRGFSANANGVHPFDRWQITPKP